MKINRLTEIDVEKEYDKVDDDYQVLSDIIQDLYQKGSTVDPETHAFLKRQKDPRFAADLEGMRKRTTTFDLDEYGDPIEGGENFTPEMGEFEELQLADGGRVGEIEQEIMDLEYQQEQALYERVKDEPGLQEVSLFAPKAPVKILSQALNTGTSKLASMVPQQVTEAFAGLPSLMARGSGEGFERFGKRRGAGTSRVNQNLDELISDFFAQSKGGTDLSDVSQYTLELLRANMPAIRAAAARQKQNPKAGLNRIIKIMDELE